MKLRKRNDKVIFKVTKGILFSLRVRHCFVLAKLLKCRELRKRMISEAIWKQSARRGVSAMMEHERRKRIPDFGGSDSEVNYGSDTESHEDNWGNGESEEQQRPQSRQTKQTLKVSPFSPKYKSKSNADFKKLISSPRPHQLCSCQITANLDDDEIVNEYMQRFITAECFYH